MRCDRNAKNNRNLYVVFLLEFPFPAIITIPSNDKRLDVFSAGAFSIHNSHASNTLTAGSNANQSFSGESKRC